MDYKHIELQIEEFKKRVDKIECKDTICIGKPETGQYYYLIDIDEAIDESFQNMKNADWNGCPSYGGWKYEYKRLRTLRDSGQRFEVKP